MCDDYDHEFGDVDSETIDYDPYDFQLESSESDSESEEDRKGPQPGENFICVSESSRTRETSQTWTRRG